MGIKDLKPTIQKRCPEKIRTINISDLAGVRIALDIMVFLYKYLRSVGEDNWIAFMIQCLSTFARHRVDIVCVFDGKNVPIEKEKEREKRRKDANSIFTKIEELKLLLDIVRKGKGPIEDTKQINAINDILDRQRKIEGQSIVNFSKRSTVIWVLTQTLNKWEKQTLFVNSEHIRITKELCKILRIPVYQAKGEGETICACLCLSGNVDAVYTQDTDVLAYGCPVQLFDFDVKNETMNMIYLQDILDCFEFTFDQFRDFCIMLKCDYNERAPDIGPAKAFELITEYISIESIEDVDPDTIEDKKMRNMVIKFQSGVHNLIYERCRELFKYRKVVNVKWRPIREIDIGNMNKFLVNNKVYSKTRGLTAEKLLDVWQPTKIVFKE